MEENHKNLDEISRKDVFKTPENYFDQLHGRIEERISSTQGKGKLVEFYSQHRYKVIGFAAAAAVSLLIVFLPATHRSQPDANSILAQVSVDDCLAYLQTSELGMDDIIRNTTSEDVDAAFEDYLVPVPEIDSDDLDDLLFEKFGATSDEKLKSL